MTKSLPKQLNKFIFHFISKQRFLFLILMICQLAWAIDQTVMPLIFKNFLRTLINFNGNIELGEDNQHEYINQLNMFMESHC